MIFLQFFVHISEFLFPPEKNDLENLPWHVFDNVLKNLSDKDKCSFRFVSKTLFAKIEDREGKCAHCFGYDHSGGPNIAETDRCQHPENSRQRTAEEIDRIFSLEMMDMHLFAMELEKMHLMDLCDLRSSSQTLEAKIDSLIGDCECGGWFNEDHSRRSRNW